MNAQIFDMVYAFLYRNSRQAPEGFRKLFNENMRKMMYTPIKIDASEENKVFGTVSFSYSGHILPMTYTLVNLNGETVECWKILKRPALGIR